MSTINEALIPYPCHPDNKPGRGRRPVGAVLHHMAGYLPGTDGIFRNPATGYATNLGIGSLNGSDYIVHEYVPEGEVAWGNGNDHLNAAAISIEHENNRAAGPASKPTPEVHELSARTLARQAVQWDWRINGKVQLVLRDFPNHDFYDETVPGFGTEFNVTGHRTVALKDCPNELDMVWIVARANQILAGGGGATGKKDDMEFRVITDSNPPVGVVYDSTTFTEINQGTDPVEFAASENAHGAGSNRMFLTANEWRIEKIQIAKRAAAQAERIAKAIPAATVPALTDEQLEKIAAAIDMPAAPTVFEITGTANAAS